jgi:sugar phosphate isomerase/epimerase
MYFGYNTNGFAHHRLDDALDLLAELGYQGVAITVDHYVLNPLQHGWQNEAVRVRRRLSRLGFRCVIETGARFLLDTRHKHQPTLLSSTPEARGRRIRFLLDCVELARLLGAEAVSFWSGTPADDAPTEVLWQRLIDGCRELAHAARGVRLAFEPEPGMFIDTMARFAELQDRLAPSPLGLTLDVGHLHCLDEGPIADHIRRWKDVLWNVHIEDMRRGVHDHLKFGDGEMEFPPILQALRDVGYAGGVYVELSRHSHDAVRTAKESLAFLESATPST